MAINITIIVVIIVSVGVLAGWSEPAGALGSPINGARARELTSADRCGQLRPDAGQVEAVVVWSCCGRGHVKAGRLRLPPAGAATGPRQIHEKLPL